MWEVRKSRVHGSGIYATENIAKDTRIIEYIGQKISKKEGDRRSELRINHCFCWLQQQDDHIFHCINY